MYLVCLVIVEMMGCLENEEMDGGVHAATENVLAFVLRLRFLSVRTDVRSS